jgi:hypothetical protein
MNSNVKLLAQFLISTEVIGLLVWMVHILVSTPAIAPETRQVLENVVANIIPLAAGAVGFWLGSSLSSASKDHTISVVATKGTS